jgi:hypothetical protein
MEQNKTGKYLKYAIGEIVLVVIGILIALQINTWNQQRLNVKKERNMLLEIKENLNEDLQSVADILDFNANKKKAIDSAYYYLYMMNENPRLGRQFSQLMPTITNYHFFQSTKVAFNNLTSSGNIDIFQSDDLRKKISTYYSRNDLDVVQEQLKETTQSYLNNLAPKMINKDMMLKVTKREFDILNVEEINVHKDPQVLSDLFVMWNKTFEHNDLLLELEKVIKSLIESIDDYLNK